MENDAPLQCNMLEAHDILKMITAGGLHDKTSVRSRSQRILRDSNPVPEERGQVLVPVDPRGSVCDSQFCGWGENLVDRTTHFIRLHVGFRSCWKQCTPELSESIHGLLQLRKMTRAFPFETAVVTAGYICVGKLHNTPAVSVRRRRGGADATRLRPASEVSHPLADDDNALNVLSVTKYR